MIDGFSPDHLPADLMGETPHLAVMSSYLDEASKHIARLQAKADELVAKANESAVPLVFVEGESDKLLFKAAWSHFVGDEHAIRIESCEGTSKMEGLAANGAVLVKLSPGRKTCVLVDNDGEGRGLYKNSKLGARGGRWIRHNSNRTYWCRLHVSDEFVGEMESIGLPEHCWPGTLENIFSRDLRLRAINAGSYELSSIPFDDILKGGFFSKIAHLLQAGPSQKIYVMAPSPESKMHFSEWLVEEASLNSSVLAPLRQIVLDLYGIVTGSEQPAHEEGSQIQTA